MSSKRNFVDSAESPWNTIVSSVGGVTASSSTQDCSASSVSSQPDSLVLLATAAAAPTHPSSSSCKRSPPPPLLASEVEQAVIVYQRREGGIRRSEEAILAAIESAGVHCEHMEDLRASIQRGLEAAQAARAEYRRGAGLTSHHVHNPKKPQRGRRQVDLSAGTAGAPWNFLFPENTSHTVVVASEVISLDEWLSIMTELKHRVLSRLAKEEAHETPTTGGMTRGARERHAAFNALLELQGSTAGAGTKSSHPDDMMMHPNPSATTTDISLAQLQTFASQFGLRMDLALPPHSSSSSSSDPTKFMSASLSYGNASLRSPSSAITPPPPPPPGIKFEQFTALLDRLTKKHPNPSSSHQTAMNSDSITDDGTIDEDEVMRLPDASSSRATPMEEGEEGEGGLAGEDEEGRSLVVDGGSHNHFGSLDASSSPIGSIPSRGQTSLGYASQSVSQCDASRRPNHHHHPGGRYASNTTLQTMQKVLQKHQTTVQAHRNHHWALEDLLDEIPFPPAAPKFSPTRNRNDAAPLHDPKHRVELKRPQSARPALPTDRMPSRSATAIPQMRRGKAGERDWTTSPHSPRPMSAAVTPPRRRQESVSAELQYDTPIEEDPTVLGGGSPPRTRPGTDFHQRGRPAGAQQPVASSSSAPTSSLSAQAMAALESLGSIAVTPHLELLRRWARTPPTSASSPVFGPSSSGGGGLHPAPPHSAASGGAPHRASMRPGSGAAAGGGLSEDGPRPSSSVQTMPAALTRSISQRGAGGTASRVGTNSRLTRSSSSAADCAGGASSSTPLYSSNNNNNNHHPHANKIVVPNRPNTAGRFRHLKGGSDSTQQQQPQQPPADRTTSPLLRDHLLLEEVTMKLSARAIESPVVALMSRHATQPHTSASPLEPRQPIHPHRHREQQHQGTLKPPHSQRQQQQQTTVRANSTAAAVAAYLRPAVVASALSSPSKRRRRRTSSTHHNPTRRVDPHTQPTAAAAAVATANQPQTPLPPHALPNGGTQSAGMECAARSPTTTTATSAAAVDTGDDRSTVVPAHYTGRRLSHHYATSELSGMDQFSQDDGNNASHTGGGAGGDLLMMEVGTGSGVGGGSKSSPNLSAMLPTSGSHDSNGPNQARQSKGSTEDDDDLQPSAAGGVPPSISPDPLFHQARPSIIILNGATANKEPAAAERRQSHQAREAEEEDDDLDIPDCDDDGDTDDEAADKAAGVDLLAEAEGVPSSRNRSTSSAVERELSVESVPNYCAQPSSSSTPQLKVGSSSSSSSLQPQRSATSNNSHVAVPPLMEVPALVSPTPEPEGGREGGGGGGGAPSNANSYYILTTSTSGSATMVLATSANTATPLGTTVPPPPATTRSGAARNNSRYRSPTRPAGAGDSSGSPPFHSLINSPCDADDRFLRSHPLDVPPLNGPHHHQRLSNAQRSSVLSTASARTNRSGSTRTTRTSSTRGSSLFDGIGSVTGATPKRNLSTVSGMGGEDRKLSSNSGSGHSSSSLDDVRRALLGLQLNSALRIQRQWRRFTLRRRCAVRLLQRCGRGFSSRVDVALYFRATLAALTLRTRSSNPITSLTSSPAPSLPVSLTTPRLTTEVHDGAGTSSGLNSTLASPTHDEVGPRHSGGSNPSHVDSGDDPLSVHHHHHDSSRHPFLQLTDNDEEGEGEIASQGGPFGDVDDDEEDGALVETNSSFSDASSDHEEALSHLLGKQSALGQRVASLPKMTQRASTATVASSVASTRRRFSEVERRSSQRRPSTEATSAGGSDHDDAGGAAAAGFHPVNSWTVGGRRRSTTDVSSSALLTAHSGGGAATTTSSALPRRRSLQETPNARIAFVGVPQQDSPAPPHREQRSPNGRQGSAAWPSFPLFLQRSEVAGDGGGGERAASAAAAAAEGRRQSTATDVLSPRPPSSTTSSRLRSGFSRGSTTGDQSLTTPLVVAKHVAANAVTGEHSFINPFTMSVTMSRSGGMAARSTALSEERPQQQPQPSQHPQLPLSEPGASASSTSVAHHSSGSGGGGAHPPQRWEQPLPIRSGGSAGGLSSPELHSFAGTAVSDDRKNEQHSPHLNLGDSSATTTNKSGSFAGSATGGDAASSTSHRPHHHHPHHVASARRFHDEEPAPSPNGMDDDDKGEEEEIVSDQQVTDLLSGMLADAYWESSRFDFDSASRSGKHHFTNNSAAARLQRVGRAFAVRQRLYHRREGKLYEAPARLIQSCGRMWMAARQLAAVRNAIREAAAELELWNQRDAAAMVVQKIVRGWFAMAHYKAMRRKVLVRTELRVVSEGPEEE